MKIFAPLTVLVLCILLIFPAQAVTIGTTACIGVSHPCSENHSPTIDQVDYEISLYDRDLSLQVFVQASDVNGINDIDFVKATLFYQNLAILYPNTPNPPRIQLDQKNIPLNNQLDFDSGIFIGSLSHQNAKPGFYILKAEVFDKAGVSAAEEIDVLVISGIKGDFSGDGRVSPWDITYLARHYAHLSGYENIYSYEVSSDGNLTPWDITYLARAIARITGYNL